MTFDTVRIIFYIAILIPAVIYLVAYVSTRRRRVTMLDVPLVGLPVSLILLVGQALFFPYLQVVPRRIIAVIVFSIVAVMMWTLLFALIRVRRTAYTDRRDRHDAEHSRPSSPH